MTNKRVIESDLNQAREVEEDILRRIADCGYSEEDVFGIKLSLEEGLTNAIRHGNHFDPAKSVTVHYEVTGEKVEVSIEDEGAGFDPQALPDPTADENLERPCGRGIMLIHAYMDEVSYNQSGNLVHMTKHNSRRKERAS